MKLAVLVCWFSSLLGCSTAPNSNANAGEPTSAIAASAIPAMPAPPLEEFILAKLKKAKLTHPVYQQQLGTLLNDPKKPYEKVLSLNLLGFLGKANYSVHYSERTLRHARKFLKANSRSLARAQKKYGVSPESIAALLWVETQYGKITGKNPLVQVFLSLLMADHPDRIQALLKEGNDRRTIDEEIRKRYPDPKAFDQKIVDRTRLKSDWALEQLQAIESLRKGGYTKVTSLNGSFAGAFGVPQFIPSTYRDLAVSAQAGRRPNLYKMPDVILSVGNFLKKKGWREKIPESKSTALYEYNRIKDYGDVILKIAEELRAERKPTSSSDPVDAEDE